MANCQTKLKCKQECGKAAYYPPLLFLITLDCVLHDALDNHSRGIQWGLHDQLESLEYADDICLLSHTQEAMAAKLEDIRREAGKVGLKINAAKTKEIRAGTGNARPILLSAEPVERVQHFTYLESVVSEDGGASEDVDARIAKARIAFTQLRKVWRTSMLSRRVKIQLFNSNVKSVLLFGCETWKVTNVITQRLQVFVNRCLRTLTNIYWPKTITNSLLWKLCEQEPIDLQIRRRKWKWIGHTLRKEHNNLAKQAMEWNPQGKRKQGRPKMTWRRTVAGEAESINKNWQQLKVDANNRVRWRSVVDALCPREGS